MSDRHDGSPWAAPSHDPSPTRSAPARRTARRTSPVVVILGVVIAVLAVALGGMLVAMNRNGGQGQGGQAAVVAGGVDQAEGAAGEQQAEERLEEPKTKEAARVAAARSYDAYAAGDWAGAWDEWSPAAKKLLSRAEYVRFHEECQTPVGLPFEIKNVRVEGDRAIVRTERLTISFSDTLIHDGTRWWYQPSKVNQAEYRKGVDKLLAEWRARGSCAKP